MVEPWFMVLPFNKQPGHLSRQDYLKLRRFYTQQLALSQALLEVKLPGICKTTTSVRNHTLEQTLMEGDIKCIPSRNDSKEMS